MIKLRLTDEDISDIHEALDDPMIDQRNRAQDKFFLYR
jgi:hypothetical protein